MQTVSFNLFMNALEKNIIAFDMLAYSDNTLNSFIDMGIDHKKHPSSEPPKKQI